MDAKHNFWLDRPVLVTAGTSLVCDWLPEAGADVVCLLRDWVPNRELIKSNLIEHTTVDCGDLREGDHLEAHDRRVRNRPVIYLGAQAVACGANRNFVSTFESNFYRRLELRRQAFNFSYESQVTVLGLVKVL